MSNPQPGVYNDPLEPGKYRYWDGNAWGEQVEPPMQTAPAVQGGPSGQAYGAPHASQSNQWQTQGSANYRAPEGWAPPPSYGFVEAVKTGLKKYVTFTGRASRSEYWFFVLGQILAITVPVILGTVMFGVADASGLGVLAGLGVILWILGFLSFLVFFIPGLAVQVRRLHDVDKPGWLIVLLFIPIVSFVGSIVLIVFNTMPGTEGPNRYESDKF